MSNEKHDPWALLRDATSYLDDVVRSAPEKWRWTDEQREAHDLMHRIDAALAAHDAVPPSEEKVEWRNTPDGEDAVINNVVLSVWGWRGGWAWQSKPLAEPSYLNRTEMGLSKTLDEAKSAAIAAARGMK